MSSLRLSGMRQGRILAPDPSALRVGDLVEVVSLPPHAGRVRVKVGDRGIVIATGWSFGLVSIELARSSVPAVMVHPRHLQRVEAPDAA